MGDQVAKKPKRPMRKPVKAIREFTVIVTRPPDPEIIREIRARIIRKHFPEMDDE